MLFYQYKNNQFESITSLSLSKPDDDVTYGASVIDINKDGLDDLLIARESGGHIYINENGRFAHTKIELHLNKKSRPISFALGDINKDGHIDLFVSAYLEKSAMEGQNIFNKEGYGASSVLLLNNGDNTFTDVTEPYGMTYIHNTFLGIFADMDEDRDLDLVVAHDTGQVRTWRNNGNGSFTNAVNPFSKVYGYPMGIAAGDYDNDGRIDFYFSNVGPTAPPFLAKGDLREDQVYFPDLMLMKNEGEFQFTDAAPKAKLSAYEFSWGTVMADINLDGLQDILIAENYVDFPLHKFFKLPGRVLLQRKDHTFASIESESETINRNYEITPLLADFNGDGYLDQIRVNLAGKSKAFVSQKGKNNYLKVKIPAIAELFGSKVIAELSDGKKLTDWLISGEGLGSDQDHTIIFGLGESNRVQQLTVQRPDGKVYSKVLSGELNQLIDFSKQDLGL